MEKEKKSNQFQIKLRASGEMHLSGDDENCDNSLRCDPQNRLQPPFG